MSIRHSLNMLKTVYFTQYLPLFYAKIFTTVALQTTLNTTYVKYKGTFVLQIVTMNFLNNRLNICRKHHII